MSFNKGEIGATVYAAFGSDISTATSIKMILEPEAGTAKEFTAVLGTSDITVDNINYSANEYAYFTTTKENDLDYIGRWRKKLVATFSASSVLQSDYSKFRVLS